jgi:sporulation protein YlmC with PRC-barrel domain
MRTLEDVQTWRGMKLVDADGEKIGTIDDIFLDRQTGAPEWATVKTGLFGLKTSFVPIVDAQPAGEDELRVPISKDQVKDAPRIDAEGELTPEEEQRLWEHYGRSDYSEWRGDDRTADLGLPAEEGRFSRPEAAPGAGEQGTPPPIVGVRLRRFVIVTEPEPARREDQPGRGA